METILAWHLFSLSFGAEAFQPQPGRSPEVPEYLRIVAPAQIDMELAGPRGQATHGPDTTVQDRID